MIIVLIHWRIKPTPEDEQAFLTWWKNDAPINDKCNLIGEFLSAPMPAKDFKFAVNDLSARTDEPAHKAFINVGLWKDWESFFEEVGHNFNDDNPPKPFEAARRTRTILSPEEWRRGDFNLSNTSTCP